MRSRRTRVRSLSDILAQWIPAGKLLAVEPGAEPAEWLSACLAVNPGLPVKSVKELIAFAAARPKLASECGYIAAKIHAVPVESLPALRAQTAEDQIVQFEGLLDAFGEPRELMRLIGGHALGQERRGALHPRVQLLDQRTPLVGDARE